MMIEFLESIDREIVLSINGLNTPLLDVIMWWVTKNVTWLTPVFFTYLFYGKTKDIKQTLLLVITLILAVSIADLSSVHLFKNVFERYRPSHNLLLSDQLHFYQYEDGSFYQGGLYGFVSSHAANMLAICTVLFLALKRFYRNIQIVLIFLAILVGLSRVYFGVHYLSDVIAGAILGIFTGVIAVKFFYKRFSG